VGNKFKLKNVLKDLIILYKDILFKVILEHSFIIILVTCLMLYIFELNPIKFIFTYFLIKYLIESARQLKNNR